jgi:toxin-antitoxin system PIN domain toxin
VILIDANLLLYAYNASSEHHPTAKSWIERVFSSSEPVGLAWVTILAFQRIVTNSRALERPLSEREAVSIVNGWLALPAIRVFDPGQRHWVIFSELVRASQARGPLIMDAHLAAIAVEHGLVLCTNDKDFTRFAGLRVCNPLAEYKQEA